MLPRSARPNAAGCCCHGMPRAVAMVVGRRLRRQMPATALAVQLRAQVQAARRMLLRAPKCSSSCSDSTSPRIGARRTEPAASSTRDARDQADQALASGRGQGEELKAGRTRTKEHREDFGSCFMTSRWKHGVLCGYQVTCGNPQRNQGQKCTKEVSIGVAGSAAQARKMLKSWMVWGGGGASRKDHFDAWRVVVQHTQAGFSLPSEESLDKHAPTQWDVDVLPVPTVETFASPAGLAAGVALLGERGPDVPEPIHAEMERLAQLGALPIATLEQRRRNKGTAGSTYGVPRFFAAARQHGYLSPNFEAPSGYRWVSRSGAWTLTVKGG